MTAPRPHRRRLPSIPTPILALIGVLVGVLFLRFYGIGDATSHHPEPRDGVTAAAVMPAARYADYPLIARVYDQAREVPAVLDGLYCHCDCAEHSGHRSLLSCFESDHGAGCDICLEEATLAHRMTRDGESLREIRQAIDAMFSS